MSVLTRFTTFVDGDELPASDLNGEFDEIHDALDGTNNREVEIGSTSGPVLTVNGKGVAPQSWKITGTEKCKINASGQIESVIANGTAPIVVASTTKVANLNADFLDGNAASNVSKVTYSSHLGAVTGLRTAWGLPPLLSGYTKYTLSSLVGITPPDIPAGPPTAQAQMTLTLYKAAGGEATAGAATATVGNIGGGVNTTDIDTLLATLVTNFNAAVSTAAETLQAGDFVVFSFGITLGTPEVLLCVEFTPTA